MQPTWHIAFCNVTYTEYAGVSYADYYASPATMLETQLAARDFAERRFGVGRFMHPHPDSPACLFASYLGVPVIAPVEDELPYLDARHPVITEVADHERVRPGDPRTAGWMARRWDAWQYYRDHGYRGAFGGYGGGIITVAGEISSGAVFRGLAEDPEGARLLLERLVAAEEHVARFAAALERGTYSGMGYTGDDYSGLLSPAMYRTFAVPCYRRLYGASSTRFMHSELLRAEHLRLARGEVEITEFHGAGSVNLTLAEQYQIMGEQFWTQLTPQEMLELSPAAIRERLRAFADCGCKCVQLYPGRGTPTDHMTAAIEACRDLCPGGPAW